MSDAPQPLGNHAQIYPLPVNSALVVQPVLADAVAIAATLTARQFRVTIAETFAAAKDRLASRPPEVLIADVRLGEYNGLHLVLRSMSLRADTAALVTSNSYDPVLAADAEALGATFMIKPLSDAELAAAIFRTIFRAKNAAGSPPIRPPFERRSEERRAEVIPMPTDRRRAERRRDLEHLLRAVGRGPVPIDRPRQA